MTRRRKFRHTFPPFLLAFAIAACGTDYPFTPDPPEPPRTPDVSWIEANAHSFRTAEPGGDDSDLMPLKELIGDARIVALGEATHGTREFLQMKHRVLEFLVREMNFDVFAIEATWAESNDVNRYVHTGEADAAMVLSNLYFWTWNTAEVLDMIRWMREHNRSGGGRDISFFGFDMQFSQRAMDEVWAYAIEHIEPVHPDITALLGMSYSCWRIWERASNYPDRPHVKQECRDGVRAVYARLADEREDYTRLSGPDAYEHALRAARIVVQHEWLASRDWVGHEPNPRDRYLAENAEWILERAGPDAKIVLWAHNAHIMDVPGWMRRYLRESYGDQMVIVGFSFSGGSFNAVPFSMGAPSGSLTPFSAPPPLRESYEFSFAETGMPHILLDLRPLRAAAPESAAWLHGPRPMRTIGCCYDPSRADEYYMSTRITDFFDVIIHFEHTHPSVLLPFVGTTP